MSSRPISIVVLGGTGIIGSEFCAHAADRGALVTALGRSGQKRGLDERVSYVGADVRDPGAIRAVTEGRTFDAVLDLLSFTPSQLASTLAAIAGRFGQYILVSSATIYDGARPGSAIAESSPTVDSGWTYAELKVRTEELLRNSSKAASSAFTIVRPYITYSTQRVPLGLWEVSDVLPQLLRGHPLPMPEAIRMASTSVTHARDVARAIFALIANPAAIDEDFIVAAPMAPTWDEIFDGLAIAIGRPVEMLSVPVGRTLEVFPELAGKVADRCLDRRFDTSKLESACPGFRFEVSAAEGYMEVVPSLLDRSWPAAGRAFHGRLDRLLLSGGASDVPLSRAAYLDLVTGSRTRDWLRYRAGFSSLFWDLHSRRPAGGRISG